MQSNVTSNITTTIISSVITTKPTIPQTENSDRTETARITVYSLIIIISFLGNGLLVLTMMLTRRMRTTTNYFLLNMAIGDLLVATICAPYQLASWKYPSIKTFDQRICKAMPFIQMSTVGVSIFTMLAMAFDRYRVVLYPLRKRMTKRVRILVILAIWVATAATAAPMLFVYEVKTIARPNDTEVTICGEFGWTNFQRDSAAYTYALFTLQYALPGFLQGYLYLRIFLHLWFHSFPGMQHMSKANWQTFRKKHYRRKKTAIMLLSVFLAFMLCNLPMHVISFIFYIVGPKFKPPTYMPLIAMSSEMAMYANSAVNPVLYGFLHEKFKACLIALLKWLVCGTQRPNFENIQVRKARKKCSTAITISSSSSVKWTPKGRKTAETNL